MTHIVSRLKRLGRVAVVGLALCGLVTLLFYKAPEPIEPQVPLFKVGEKRSLSVGTYVSHVNVFDTEGALDRYVALLPTKRNFGGIEGLADVIRASELRSIRGQGVSAMVTAGVLVRVLGQNGKRVRVKILSGDSKGGSGWVHYKWVR